MNLLTAYKKRTAAKMSSVAELMLYISRGLGHKSVTHLIALAMKEKIASNTTLHVALKWLRTNGYVKTVLDADQRVKFCTITSKGEKYLDEIK
jgi:hypothetical protein